MANRYWVGGTDTWNATAGTKWSTTSGGAGGAAVPTAADDVFFDAASGAGTVTVSGSRPCLSFNATGFTGTLAGTSTPNLQVYGNLTLGSGMTVAGTLTTVTFLGVGSFTITTNGISLVNVTFNNAGDTWTLQDALTATGTVTLTAGILALGSYTLACNSFVMTSTTSKTLNFGTGKISLNGTTTATVWNSASNTNTTLSGTVLIEVTAPGSGVTKTISSGTTTISPSLNFSVVSGSTGGTITFTASMQIGDLTLGNFSYTVSNIAISIYGNLNVGGSNITLTAGSNAWTFAAASGTETITTNGVTLDFPLTFNGASATWQLQDALTVGATRTVTLTDGTIDLQSYTLTMGLFSSTNSNTRTIAFGTGKIVLNGTATATIWNTSTATNFTTTGTNKLIEVTAPGSSVTKTITFGSITEANTIDLTIIAGSTTGTIAFTGSVKNVTFSDLAYTVSGPATTRTIFGNFTVSGTTPTFTSTTSVTTFGATSGTQTITTNGKTLDIAVTINAPGGTVELADAFTTGSSGNFILTAGTFSLQSYTLTCNVFSSNVTNTRTLSFGTGKILMTGSATSTFNGTNLSATGTKLIERSGSGNTSTTFGSNFTESAALNLSLISGVSNTHTITGYYNNLNVGNFTLTLGTSTNISLFGDLFLGGTNITWAVGSANVIFRGTTGTKLITTNGASVGNGMTFQGGATYQLQDALTLVGSFSIFPSVSLTSGILDLNDYTLTTVRFATSGSTTRSIDFGTGKIVLTCSDTAQVGLDMSSTNYSVSGTNLIELSSTYNARTFPDGTESTAPNLTFLATAKASGISGAVNNLTAAGSSNSFTSEGTLTVYGNLTFNGSGIQFFLSSTGISLTIKFAATSGTKTITTSNANVDARIDFDGVGGTWSFSDNFKQSTQASRGASEIFRITLTNGTVQLNGRTLSVNSFLSGSTNTRTLDFTGGGDIRIISDSTVYTGNDLLDINCSNLTVTNPSLGFITSGNETSAAKEFRVGRGTTTTTLPTIRNFNNVSLYINSNGGVRLYNLAGSTPTQNQSFTFNTTGFGTFFFDNFGILPSVGITITLNVDGGSGTFTFSQSGGVISNQRLNITNSIATGGATWYAGSTSTDGGNNTGWIFSDAPTDTGNAMFLMFV